MVACNILPPLTCWQKYERHHWCLRMLCELWLSQVVQYRSRQIKHEPRWCYWDFTVLNRLHTSVRAYKHRTPGPKFIITFGVNYFHLCRWSVHNARKLCCLLRCRQVYSWLTAAYTVHFIPVVTAISLSFIHCLHVHKLPHSRSPTHTSRTALFMKELRHSHSTLLK